MAISKELQAVLDRQGSLTDAQQRELAQHNFETGSGGTKFTDSTFGLLDYKDINTVGSEVYKRFNPENLARTQTDLAKAQDIYKQTTGADLRGDSLNVVTGHLQQGDSVEKALANLGNLKWNEMNRDASGEPLALAGKLNESGYMLQPGESILPEGTSRTVGGASAPNMTTTQFAQAYKAKYGVEPTNEQKIAFTQQRASGFDINSIVNQLPPPDKSISLGQMDNEQNINLGDGVVDDGTSTLADATVLGTQNIVVPQIKDQLTDAQSQEQSILDEMAKLVEEDVGKGAEQAKLEAEAKIAEQEANVQRIVDTIASKTKEYEAYKLAQEGKPITLASISGNIAQKRNQIASEIAMLQGEAYIAQGQLKQAQASIDRAIDLKYSSVENRYKILQAQLQALQPSLDRQEKAQALALQRQYQSEQQAIADQKANDKQIQSIMLNLASAGASQDLISRASSAGSVAEASQILGEFTRSQQVATGSGGGVGGGSFVPQPQIQVPTFEQFVSQKEEQLGMSVANREQFREEYNQLVEQPIVSQLSLRAQSVYDNPKLINNYTATEKGKLTDEIANAGLDPSVLIASQLSSTAIKEISQTQDALDSLYDLQNKLSLNADQIGPLTGLEALNPWSPKRKIRADIDRIRQTVGKALEGGVLRKEDEEKYKKILATITDTPDTAEYKITQLIADIKGNMSNYTQLQGLPENYVGDLLNKPSGTAQLSDEQAYQEYLTLINQ